MLPEEWRACVGYEGFYEVSSHGRVRSVPHMTRLGLRGGKVRKLQTDRKGYLFLRMGIGSQRPERNERVHQLVALAFIPNPENKPTVNHIDGMRSNARAGNLEWATRSEQELHAWRVLKRKPPRNQLGKSGDLHHNSVAVIATHPDGTTHRYASMNLATADGFCRSGIHHAIAHGVAYKGAAWRREIPLNSESRM